MDVCWHRQLAVGMLGLAVTLTAVAADFVPGSVTIESSCNTEVFPPQVRPRITKLCMNVKRHRHVGIRSVSESGQLKP